MTFSNAKKLIHDPRANQGQPIGTQKLGISVFRLPGRGVGMEPTGIICAKGVLRFFAAPSEGDGGLLTALLLRIVWASSPCLPKDLDIS